MGIFHRHNDFYTVKTV